MGATQLNGNQVKDGTIGISDLSATGTPSSSTYLRGDNTWSAPPGGAGSGITRVISNISGTTTGAAVTITDYVYLCTGTFTYTQPTAVSNTNRYTIKNVGTGTITISTTSSQTIEGTTTITLSSGSSVDLISDNTNWFII